MSSSTEVLLCTSGYDHTIRLWNVVQGNCTAVLQHNESHVNALSIAPDRSLIAAAGNPCVRIYDPHYTSTIGNSSSSTSVSTSTALHILHLRGGPGEEEEQRVNVLDVAFHNPQVVMAAAEDGSVRLWDLRLPGKSISQTQLSSGSKVTSVYLETEGMRVWYGDAKGRVYGWDLSSNKLFFEKAVAGASEMSAVTVVGRTILCGDHDGRVWSLSNDSEQIVHSHQGPVTYLGNSPDGQFLISTSGDKTAQLYSVNEDAIERKSCLVGHSKWVWDATFSADSMYVLTASTDCSARLWEVETGDQISIFTGQHTKGITSVALNDLY